MEKKENNTYNNFSTGEIFYRREGGPLEKKSDVVWLENYVPNQKHTRSCDNTGWKKKLATQTTQRMPSNIQGNRGLKKEGQGRGSGA